MGYVLKLELFIIIFMIYKVYFFMGLQIYLGFTSNWVSLWKPNFYSPDLMNLLHRLHSLLID